MRNFCLLFLVLTLSFSSFSQQLMINEVSQGTGSAEYVEFVVIGNPICEGETIPCIDLRKVIIDDNNGFFQQGAGTGIATGALRFSNDAIWSCVPQGTYIVVYNEGSPNSSLPADDNSLTDGNCTLIIPGNSPLLESTNVSPTAAPFNPLYPTSDSDWGPSTGWNAVAMANSDDSFQIPNLGVNGTPLHSVSWGNNTTGTIIYFAGSVVGKVMSFKNTIDNDFNSQANWVQEDVAVGQSPGAANSDENDLWIGTMNPTCRVNPALIFDVTNSDCNSSNGSITLTVANSADIDILWENGATTATISNLTQGTYTVTVTDNITGCIFIDSAVVALNNSTLALNPVIIDESCTNFCDGSVNLNITGGQTPYTEIWSQNGSSITTPTSFCNGTYEIQVTDANQCQITQTITVGTTTPFIYSVSNDTTICLGDMVTLKVIGGTSYLWTPNNDTTSQITILPFFSQPVTVIITEGGCSESEIISLWVTDCDFGLEFPNIFTPDGDNTNEYFVPIAFAGITNQEFIILNRWGNLVYETKDQNIKWDGKIDGKDATEGVYFYQLTYLDATNTSQKLHGFLHLKRK